MDQRVPHLLVVDDDREISTLVSQFLTRHGYRVSTARDGQDMLRRLDEWAIDLIILDLMLPGTDGLTLCRQIRASSTLPIIMLTAMGEDMDRIVGLEMGADDYLAKPFNPRELLARVKAVLRRTDAAPKAEQPPAGSVLEFAGWRLDLTRRELHSPDGVQIDMSAGQLDLLAAFVGHPQRVLTRDQLLDLSRGRAAGPFDRSIDVQVSRLRRKIEPDPREPTLIKTVRSGGYIFTPVVQAR